MNSEDLYNFVPYGDVLAAARAIHGGHVTLMSYTVHRGTTSVQGFTSLMLRVHATLESHGETIEARIIVKRLPLLAKQFDIMSNDFNMYDRERVYFTKVAPTLRAKGVTSLPECYLAYGTTIIMEDLCLSGYKTLFRDLKEFAANEVSISYSRLIMRKLAQLHASSLDCTWDTEVEENLAKDAMVNDVMKRMVGYVCKIVINVMKHIYPDEAKHGKYVAWLEGTNCFELTAKLVQPLTNGLNVISHGDFWLNNMMFKIDPDTQEPTDMKFVDLQVFRRCHPSRDIVYFLYMCFSRSYRQKYEKELVKTYVEAFNAAVCRTPDLVTLEEFSAELERGRWYGQTMGIFMRPLINMDNIFPTADQELSPDHVDNFLTKDHSDRAVHEFETNTRFREACTEIVEEVMFNLDSAGLV